MNARVKSVTIWSTLCGSIVLAAFIALTGQTAETQTTDPVPPAQRVSVQSSGGQANGKYSGAVTSGDGRCVAFYSDATNLLPQGSSAEMQRLPRCLQSSTARPVRCSASACRVTGRRRTGRVSRRDSARQSMKAVCVRRLARMRRTSSTAIRVVPRTSSFETSVGASLSGLVSVTAARRTGPAPFASVSGDCQLVAFQSTASRIWYRGTPTTPPTSSCTTAPLERSAVSALALEVFSGMAASLTPAISADGRCVASASAASNLIPGDTNGKIDIDVVCDGQITCRASVDSAGNQANDKHELAAGPERRRHNCGVQIERIQPGLRRSQRISRRLRAQLRDR